MNANQSEQCTADHTSPPAADDIVRREELAQRLHVDVRTVDRMVARGELPRPCVGQGGRPRWLWCYVVEFLRKRHERQAKLDRRMAAKTRSGQETTPDS